MAAGDEGRRRRLVRRLSLGRLLALVAAVPALAIAISVAIGIVAVAHQDTVRAELLNRVEPANGAAADLLIALLNQETGIRGYELTGRASFLAPYRIGLGEAREAEAKLEQDATDERALLATVQARIRDWEHDTVAPALAGPFAGSRLPALDTSLIARARFKAIRSALTDLRNALGHRVAVVHRQLHSAANTTEVALTVIGGALFLTLVLSGLLLTVLLTRPLARLAEAVRRVSAGELRHPIVLDGPRDLAALAADVDGMRRELLAELATSQRTQEQLAVSAADLRRSNSELEQFAYVASHDLQEPLRKVASFCQLLEQRYGEELDERGRTYIDFAVDGAKRMQALINDLLAFSRVGRQEPSTVPTPLGDLLARVCDDLEPVIEASGARVEWADLPTVSVDPVLMGAVFQNLVANAVKFRAQAPPRIRISAERTGTEWLLACSDNGIGIEPEYAERIFVIFQRLHTREAYPGTGIGLSLCRKIVERHGGRMWLDPDHHGGTRICFTLPADPDGPLASAPEPGAATSGAGA